MILQNFALSSTFEAEKHFLDFGLIDGEPCSTADMENVSSDKE